MPRKTKILEFWFLRVSALFARTELFGLAKLFTVTSIKVSRERSLVGELYFARLCLLEGKPEFMEWALKRVWCLAVKNSGFRNSQYNPSERAWLVAYAVFLARQIHGVPKNLAWLDIFEYFNPKHIIIKEIRRHITILFPLSDLEAVISVFECHQAQTADSSPTLSEFKRLSIKDIDLTLDRLHLRTNEDAFVIFDLWKINRFVQLGKGPSGLFLSLPIEQMHHDEQQRAANVLSETPAKLTRQEFESQNRPEFMYEYQAEFSDDVELASRLVWSVLREVYCPTGDIAVVIAEN